MAYETTSVSIEKSQGDLRKLLTKHGAAQFAFGEERDGDTRMAAVSFRHRGYAVRLRVTLKAPSQSAIGSKYSRARTKTREQVVDELYEQEERRVWRVLAWNIKARMVAVEEGVETFEEAFLAHLVNPQTNQTIYDELALDGSVSLPGTLLELPERAG
jgi:hypothetical protein